MSSDDFREFFFKMTSSGMVQGKLVIGKCFEWFILFFWWRAWHFVLVLSAFFPNGGMRGNYPT